jgi:hypothetical protein
VYSNGEEPSSLDPAVRRQQSEVIMTALLDSLTAFDHDASTRRRSSDTLPRRYRRHSIYLFPTRPPKPRGSPIRIRCPGSSRVGIRRRTTGFRRCGVTAPRSQLTILSIPGAGSWTRNGSVYGGYLAPVGNAEEIVSA